MADTNTAAPPATGTGGGSGLNLNALVAKLRRGDLALAMGVVLILTVLIMPVPTLLLDLLLAISLTVSVMILMTVLFINKPLEFSSFPTLLLITTMLRLALNLASTRLILGHGNEGTAAAGHVIEAFGQFVMGGNPIIGAIVFCILVLVNFTVITKGSGRIAEVSARFTLDAMPGKQMAIDADLSAGLIDEKAARQRRAELEEESSFFGAMDGASKFVRGDAVAGLIITAINIVAGLAIGIIQHGMEISTALQVYTLLTVGDGIVSQIPALIISTGAGLLVTKGNIVGSADKALIGQLSGYPKALGITSVLLLGMALLLPGIPTLPFVGMALLMGGLAWYLPKSRTRSTAAAAAEEQASAAAAAAPAEEPISQTLTIDGVRLELGYGLLVLINTAEGQRLTDQIKGLRKQLAQELGFIMPAVRIQDNLQLPSNGYVVRVKEIVVGSGEVRPNMVLVMDPRGEKVTLPGEATREPTFGLPATWVDNAYREEAMFKGYTVVDPPTVLTTHVAELIKDSMPELLSYAETQRLLDELPKEQQKLVVDVIPAQLSLSGLQRVLQALLAERVSIRDLPTLLEGVAEAAAYTRNITLITEHVRSRLGRQISHANTGPNGFIPLVTLTPDWEQAFLDSLVGDGEERQLAMPPTQLQQFIARTREVMDKLTQTGESPVLLTSGPIRPYVRSIVERFRPTTVVMSQNEIHPKAKIKTLGQI